jgi:superfamily II DNA or RNA helicase
MKSEFAGWSEVATCLRNDADDEERRGERDAFLNQGQRASLRAIADRLPSHGIIVADEVGMGKTRIATSVARCVTRCGGRVAILVPPGLGYQWQEELRINGVRDVRPILRSLWAYLEAWHSEEAQEQQPWFEESIVLLSHGFTNWRLGDNPKPWRRALLPELYALWCQRTDGRLPRFYRGNEVLMDPRVKRTAHSIMKTIPVSRAHVAKPFLRQLKETFKWSGSLNGDYSRGAPLRQQLEQAVGLGLGVFDLVIVDEAHKRRGLDSSLSQLLMNVIWKSKDARRVCVTATPVELDAAQWQHTLSRINLGDDTLHEIQEKIQTYSATVRRVRQCWRSSPEERENYKNAARAFQTALSPYVLRRDKSEDPHVRRFQEARGQSPSGYRLHREISIELADLPEKWLHAVCAAEALSFVTRLTEDAVAKRLRLSLGNGHGIAALIDQVKVDEKDDAAQLHVDQEESERESDPAPDRGATAMSSSKRERRANWWQGTVVQAFAEGDESLYHHPAILAAVVAIEEYTDVNRKVLVFGRFTRPMRALTDLLNARQMLKSLARKEPWLQSKVHVQRSATSTEDDWPAVRAAHSQLKEVLGLGALNRKELDRRLSNQYERFEQARQKRRASLVGRLRDGLALPAVQADLETRKVFEAFSRSVLGDKGEDLLLLSRALLVLTATGHGVLEDKASPTDLARAFISLVKSAADRDDPSADEDGDGVIDDSEADSLWAILRVRIHEEYSRTQGSFARFMYGGTSPPARRMLQAAFNRPGSFPAVLVAQSLVGREGLNLHGACRTVVLLHPEWNPGVMEQQIGRVDRVGSDWSKALEQAIGHGVKGEELPQIEIRPVVFHGTYDEHHWQVLLERWDDLRAQLHGIVIPERLAKLEGNEAGAILEEVTSYAPNFSPLRVDSDRPTHTQEFMRI